MTDDVDLTCIGPNPLFPSDGNFYISSNGYYFSDAIGGPFVRKWLKDNFVAQPNDTYVVSHPKTGTTWAQELVYLVANDVDFEKAKQESLYTRFPNLDLKMGIENNRIVSLTPPRFIKTHFPYSLLPKSIHENKCKIVYTIRNPKDTVVSFYHFYRSHKYFSYAGDFETFFKYFVDNKLVYSPFWKHVLEFWDNRLQENILILFYEDMKKDLLTQIKRVASFFGKTLSDQQILDIAEHCQFESMKKNPSTNYIHDLGKEGFQFLRKGEVGDWRNFLTDEMSEIVDDYCERHFKKIGLEFIFEL